MLFFIRYVNGFWLDTFVNFRNIVQSFVGKPNNLAIRPFSRLKLECFISNFLSTKSRLDNYAYSAPDQKVAVCKLKNG
jgi:hypothetical protein